MIYHHDLRASEPVALRREEVNLGAGPIHVNRLKNGMSSTHLLGDPEIQKFDFLGYTFHPWEVINWRGKLFVSFAPEVSDKAAKSVRQGMRRWRLHRRNDLALDGIVRWTRPVFLGWVRNYGRFQQSLLRGALCTFDRFIERWARRKYKPLSGHTMRAWEWLRRLKVRQPRLFAHWFSEAAVGPDRVKTQIQDAPVVKLYSFYALL